MAEEIERKFLVEHRDWQLNADTVGAADIEQGYLCADEDRSVRVRIQDGGAKLTIKGRTRGIKRQEFEYDVSMDEAKALLDLCGDRRVSKRRYDVRYEGKSWQVDVFTGRNEGLVVAEIELEATDESFSKPPWIVREVSDDPRYFNSNLAQHPCSEWQISP